MRIVGIDPGLKGAIATVGNGGAFVSPMPTVKAARGHELDVPAIVAMLSHRPDHVFIELVHSMPRDGVVGAFKFGKGFGELRGVLYALSIPFELVPPQEWKRVMLNGRGKTKGDSILVAREMWPRIGFKPTDDGLAEALLIATYGERKIGAARRETA